MYSEATQHNSRRCNVLCALDICRLDYLDVFLLIGDCLDAPEELPAGSHHSVQRTDSNAPFWVFDRTVYRHSF